MERKGFVLAALATVGLVFFVAAPNVQGADKGRVRVDGAWLVTSPAGIRGSEIITALDPSGRRFSVQLKMLSADATGIVCCPDGEYLTVAVGEGVMTGPSTFEATLMHYSMRSPTQEEWDAGERRDQVVCIWVTNVVGTVTEDTQDTVATFTIYPSTDADGDMLPDENDAPCLECLALPFYGKRVPMASCE